MSLNTDLKELTKSCGVNFFGVADLTRAKQFIENQGGKMLSKYPRSVSIGIRLPDSIVDELPKREKHAVAVNYRQLYDVTNQRLDIITARLSSLLKESGFEAFPVPASERYAGENIAAIFSHKLAANLAGLGWIGKSCLLVTPESGPRVRWATVLTDTPLKITGKALKVQCDDCTECVDVCPVNAFTGKPFKEYEPLEVRYNASKCEEYLGGHDDGDDWKVCGLCVYICPHGRN